MMHETNVDAKKEENVVNEIYPTTIEESNYDSLDKIEMLEVIHQHSTGDFSEQKPDQQHSTRNNSDRFEAEKVAAMRSLKTNLGLLASSCFFSLLIAKSNDIFKSFLFSLMLKLVQTF